MLLGTLSLPERFEVLEFGEDYVLGVWVDELGVEHRVGETGEEP